jgi:uncharacterized protein
MKSRRYTLKLTLTLVALIICPLSGWSKSCLWKISDRENLLYMQGSVHMLKPDNYPLKPAIMEAYRQSDILVFETDMTQMQSMETQQLILKKAMGGNLKASLNPDVYAKLSATLAEAGLPAEAVNGFKPWMVALTLSLTKLNQMGMDPALGLDMHFTQLAKKEAKPTIGLETAEFQINLMDTLSELDPNKFILHSLEELETIETQVDEMLTAWTHGDIDALGNLMLESLGKYPEMQKRFVDDRNLTWATQIDGFLKSGKTHFITVGALHYPGEKGLINLMKQKGYAVEQL